MNYVIVAGVGMTLLALAPGTAVADTCDAYRKASRGYADMGTARIKYKFKSAEWCKLYRKGQAFANKLPKRHAVVKLHNQQTCGLAAIRPTT